MAAEPQMYCMYHNGLERIYAMKDQQNAVEFKPETWWISGKTGCGKTLSVKTKFPDVCILHCCKNMWFDEYDGSETVLFDEFRHDSMEYTTLLAMLSWNRGMKMRIKGSFVWFHPKRIIFTSPESPASEFSYRAFDEQKTLRSDFAQLARRLDHQVEWNDGLQIWSDNVQDVVQGNNRPVLFNFLDVSETGLLGL